MHVNIWLLAQAIMGGEIDGWLRDDNNGISLYFAISGMDLLVLGFLAEDPSHPRHAEKDRSRSRASATHGTGLQRTASGQSKRIHLKISA